MSIFDGFPSSLRVGPFDVEVEISDELLTRKDDECWGEFDDHYCKIVLAKDQLNVVHAADTLLHETLHALWKISNLQEGDKEERIIATLATGLVQIVRDNPAIVNWLYRMIQPK